MLPSTTCQKTVFLGLKGVLASSNHGVVAR